MNKAIIEFSRPVGEVRVGFSAMLDGVTNHPNPYVKGPLVQTSPVEAITYMHGEIVRVVTRNSEYVVSADAAPQYDMNRCAR